MPGKVFKLEELSSVQIDQFDREKTAFFLPISPLEGHGAHLPLGVDYLNAIHFAETIADMVIAKRPEFDAILCPAVPLGSQVYRQPGSFRIGNRALYRLVYDLGESLATWGFKYIFLLSGHGAPKHIVALETASRNISKKYKAQMHNLSGALAVRFLSGEFNMRISKLLSHQLTETQQGQLKSDIHGGWWETSMMLLLRPDLVNPIYKELPETRRLSKNKGPKTGYYGSPALASREFAEKSLEVMAGEAFEIIDRIFSGKNRKTDTLSPLFNIYFLRPNFGLYAFTIIASLILLAIFSLLIFRS
jgi:creatinine amidohydrolase